jgi:hypothetical protein
MLTSQVNKRKEMFSMNTIGLTEEQVMAPASPAREVELTDEQLEAVYGGYGRDRDDSERPYRDRDRDDSERSYRDRDRDDSKRFLDLL